MQSDAKFGLIVGVALVVAVAVFFLSQSPPNAPTAAVESPKPAEAKTAPPRPSAAAMLPPPAPLAKPDRAAPARTVSRMQE